MPKYEVRTKSTVNEVRIVEAEDKSQIHEWNDDGMLDEHCSGPLDVDYEELQIVSITEVGDA